VAVKEHRRTFLSVIEPSDVLRPGARYILAPPVNKTYTDFKVKNKYKSSEETKTKYLLDLVCSFVEGTDTHLALETNLINLQ